MTNKVLFYDCFSGISGDINLAALIDLGVDIEYLNNELQKLKIKGYQIVTEKAIQKGISGTRLHVTIVKNSSYRLASTININIKAASKKHPSQRTFSEIKKLIDQSTLSDQVKHTSLLIFEKLAIAEGKIHDTNPDEVHFHEVGAIDSIIDIVGAAICIDYLKPDCIISSPLELGSGTITFSHGTYPVPAPATLEVLKNIPIKIGNVSFEATTPTGAAIIASLASEFSEQIDFVPEKIGYGIGHRNEGTRPNVLRVILGNRQFTSNFAFEQAILIECNIDDMNPEAYEYIFDLLFEHGAQDVFITPIMMKKLRPAQKLSVICLPNFRNTIINILLKHTTTLGVRESKIDKWMLQREIIEMQTSLGNVRVKKSIVDNTIKLKPEYEDCLFLAKKHNLPLITVMNIIQKEIYR